jgi:hypothetical protein
MAHFKFEHDFDIDAKDYWDLFFADDYNEDLNRELKMRDRKVLEQKDDGKILKRVQKMSPADDIPQMFKSVVPDIGYTEHDTFYRDRSSMDVIIEPAAGKNKFDMRAVYKVQPLGPGKCRRTFEGDVKVNVMILGGQIEKFMVEKLRTSYETAAVVTRRWITKRKGSA